MSKQFNHSALQAGITDMDCLAQLNDPKTQLQRVVTGQSGCVPKLPDNKVQLFRNTTAKASPPPPKRQQGTTSVKVYNGVPTLPDTLVQSIRHTPHRLSL